MAIADSTFSVTGWDESAYDADHPGKFSIADVKKSFEGDLEGSSDARVLLCLSDPDDYTAGAGYIGSEVVAGTLHGKQGSFVVQHGGLSGPEGQRTYGTIVPGSGTGDLATISGTFEISRDEDGTHRLRLEYVLVD